MSLGGIKIQTLVSRAAAAGNYLVHAFGASYLTSKILFSDFADWLIQTYTGFTQSGAAAVAGTLQAELRYWFRPEQFGAAADGATNDRTAISNAAAAATSTGMLIFRAGKTYLCSTSLTITAICYFEPGAVISVPTGQVITFSSRVITLGGEPVTGDGTYVLSADNNVLFL